ncbi:hypothetical protein BC831DRAFT_459618, partial [Entophlyctis helioformis]
MPVSVVLAALPWVAVLAALPGVAAQSHTGKLTFYDVGLGACGRTNTNAEAVVAVVSLACLWRRCTVASWQLTPWQSAQLYDQYRGAACGRTICINGDVIRARIVDRCEGCAYGDIGMRTGPLLLWLTLGLTCTPCATLDASPTLFQRIAPLDVGRLDVAWRFCDSASAPAPPAPPAPPRQPQPSPQPPAPPRQPQPSPQPPTPPRQPSLSAAPSHVATTMATVTITTSARSSPTPHAHVPVEQRRACMVRP